MLSSAGLVVYMSAHPGWLHVAHEEQEESGATTEEHATPAEATKHHGPLLEQESFAWATLLTDTSRKAEIGVPVGIRLGYHIDNITVLMFFMVTLVATCIHIYSIGYMSHEPRFSRFFTFLSLFCFSMLNLVIADNFFQVFISWELVGICSYLLIGFYYEKRSASCAANKAFITNRIGDVGFIVGLMAIWANFGTFQFSEIFTPEGMLRPGLPIDPFWLTVAGLGIFVGCVGKSAQFPLHVWLPDAMEGPTPVSALIHAATMVAAGVYFVARVFPLFTPQVLLVITYVGGITLFVAATVAVVSTDIKRALAYSTVSQLGYMMFALGLGGWVAGLMHLITHAFFKALLFLCSGSVIHGTGTQEMPQMGGLLKKMPITAITMLVGVLAISGTPLLSGFYSKDAIIAHTLAYWQSYPAHSLILLLPIITAGITAFYMFRLWFLTFSGTPRDQSVYDHAHECPRVMWIPLVVLAVGAVVMGGCPFLFPNVTLANFVAYGQPAAAAAGHLAPVQSAVHGAHGTATLLAFCAALLGVALAFAMYFYARLDPEEGKRQFPRVYRLLVNKWYFDELYRYLLVRPTLLFAGVCRWFDMRVIDRLVDASANKTVQLSKADGRFDLGVIDGLVNLIGKIFFDGGISLHRLQSGRLRGYVLYIAAGAVGVFALGAFLFAL